MEKKQKNENRMREERKRPGDKENIFRYSIRIPTYRVPHVTVYSNYAKIKCVEGRRN